MSKKTDKAECVTCGEYHSTTESCLKAWLSGPKTNDSSLGIIHTAKLAHPGFRVIQEGIENKR